MSSTADTFVPIVSSSPPPIDFGSSEEEDDEFGNFSAAKVQEEFESPPGIKNKGSRNHFFPIDVPHDKHNAVTTTSADSTSTPSQGTAVPYSQSAAITLPDPPLPPINNRENDGSDRTTATNNPPGSLSNGLSHPESSHGSSDSLEFVHGGERVLPDDSSEDAKFGDGSKSDDETSSERESRDDIPSSQSNSDMKNSDSGDPTEGKSDEMQHSDISWPVGDSSVPVGELPGVASQKTAEREDGRAANKTDFPAEQAFPGVGESTSDEFIESDSPLEPHKPSPPPLDSSYADEEEDEFGDFGAVDRRVPSSEPSGFPLNQDPHSVTGSDTSNNENRPSDAGDDWGSFTINYPGSESRKDPLSNVENTALSKNSGAVKASATGKESVKLKFDDVNDDDEEDEFAEFSNFRTEAVESAPAEEIPQANVAAGDDFAAFGDFKSQGSAVNKDNSDWASFGAASSTSKVDDGFGDFGSFKAPDTVVEKDDDEFASFDSARITSPKMGGSVRATQVLDGCFPASTSSVSIIAGQLSHSMQPLSGLINSLDAGVGTVGSGLSRALSNSPNGLGVWSVLSDMENTKAMGYQWTKSGSKKKLLTSIGLDERNILASKLGSVPKFASDLGMLQPSKPGEVPSQSEALSMPPEGATFQSEESVPKVEFDWSGSGLTNPLDANKLNLDFFATETKSSTPNSKTKPKTASTIDPDILNLEMPADPAPPLAPSKQTSRPLEEIMKNSTMSMVQQPIKREAGLSSEANRVLDGLPDLSYMLAKVLMFPIKSSSLPASGSSDARLGGSLLD